MLKVLSLVLVFSVVVLSYLVLLVLGLRFYRNIKKTNETSISPKMRVDNNLKYLNKQQASQTEDTSNAFNSY